MRPNLMFVSASRRPASRDRDRRQSVTKFAAWQQTRPTPTPTKVLVKLVKLLAR